MKKIILSLVFTLSVSISSFAKYVDVATAMNVAKHFYTYKATINNVVNKQTVNLYLAYSYTMGTSISAGKSAGENLYYVFDVNANDGFVIVTADNIVTPILGYCDKGSWNVNKLPPALQELIENYKQQIIYAKENNLSSTDEIKSKWDELLKEEQCNKNIYVSPRNNADMPSVNTALLTTANWGQGNISGYYNALCPTDHSLPDANNNSYRCVTGCPATAMSIIMKYWGYPATGSGIHSYNHPTYGTLSANFGSTTYNWSSMPLTDLTSANNDVATLMYQCGVSVEMNYGPDGSYGWVITSDNAVCSQSAYTTYFGYDPSTIQGLKRTGYSDPDWINLLKNELNNNRPIQYAGFGTGGHTFVCDGFDVSNYFHFNWGWCGYANGYFEINALNPGSENFNSGQQALIGIQPLSGGNTSNIQMYSYINVTPNPINFGQSFTVNADLYNAGSNTFDGDYCAALFDVSGNFINFVQTYTGSSLQSGYNTGEITFSSSGMLTVPGNYYVGIFYRPTGGNWYLAGTTWYSNLTVITINSPIGNTYGYPNNLELYSNITPSPTTFIQGQSASVNVNFANINNYTYYGQYQAALYDLNGNYVQTIGLYNETTGLAVYGYYLSPYITFSTSAITANPGSYILAIIEEEQGTSQWYLAGGDYFTNPVNINVVAAPLSPDIYENDNTQSTAYSLPVTWAGNSGNANTTGSNFHTGTDVDFYKINLASGYNYIIKARVDDSYNNATSNTYTVNAIWSYNTVSGWSTTYDDTISGNITLNVGGTLTFEVAPYFSGMTGSYLLDINITRITSSGVNEINDNNKLFEIYPNPTTNYLTLKYFDSNHFDNLQIINFMGQVVMKIKSTSSSTIENIDVSNLSNGVYYIEAVNAEQKYYLKFIIAR